MYTNIHRVCKSIYKGVVVLFFVLVVVRTYYGPTMEESLDSKLYWKKMLLYIYI